MSSTSRGGCRRLVWLEAYAAPPKPYCRSSAWRLGRAAVVVADGMAAAAAARPSLRPQFRSRRARGRWRAHRRAGGRGCAYKHATPFLLNGYPCLLCPCVVCFKFLQPKVIEGKKIDCALADPHLPRLLGGAPQAVHNEPGSPASRTPQAPPDSHRHTPMGKRSSASRRRCRRPPA